MDSVAVPLLVTVLLVLPDSMSERMCVFVDKFDLFVPHLHTYNPFFKSVSTQCTRKFEMLPRHLSILLFMMDRAFYVRVMLSFSCSMCFSTQ